MTVPIDALAHGMAVAATPENLAAAIIGALIGTAIGVLPGMSPTVAIALLLIPTAGMPPETGLILLGAVFFGTQYGDSMSAILMNVPSEAPAVVIALEGYEMTKRGRAGSALAVAAVGSFCGAVVGLIGLSLFAGAVSEFAFNFGPVEIAALTVFGMVTLTRITGAGLSSSLLAVGIGLAIPTIGIDPVTGIPRFTFGSSTLLQGVQFVPMVLGLVGMSELIEFAAGGTKVEVPTGRLRLRELWPRRQEWAECLPASLRGAVGGFIVGLIPGPALTMASFLAYRLERLVSRHRERFGTGVVAGVAAPKAADDAAVTGNLASLLTIGIPFSSVTAVLYAAFLLHNVHPGPLLVRQSPNVVWGLVVAMFVGNLALLVLNFPLVGVWVHLLRIPRPVLSAGLALLMLVGAFSLRSSALDMLVTALAGVGGYFLRRWGIDRTVVIVALVLGPLLETNVRESLALSGGDVLVFLNRPVSLVLLVVVAVVLIVPGGLKAIRRRTSNAVA